MAENGRGTIMTRPSCAWVHQRLPLLVGDDESLSDEGRDLDPAERARIARHLEDCAPCRERRAKLEHTMAILGLAAQQTAPGPDTPSVWPMLDRRIRDHHAARSRSRWHRLGRALCPQIVRNAIDRLDRTWGHLPCELPLRLAWAGDWFRDRVSGSEPGPGSSKAPGVGRAFLAAAPRLGLAIAAAVMLLVVAMADRHRSRAEIQIAANAAPIPGLEPRQGQPREEAGHVITAIVPSTETRVSSSLARTDPPPLPDPSTPEQSPPPRNPSAPRRRRRPGPDLVASL